MSDDRLEDLLAGVLRPEPATPPPDRIGAVRRQAERSAPAPAPRRGLPWWSPVLAAAAAIVGTLSIGALLEDDPPPVPREPVVLTLLPSGVDASAELIPHTWGIEVQLAVTGLPAGETYRAVVLDAAGREAPAGTFIGVGERRALCNLQAAVLRDEARTLVITDSAGDVVIRSELT